MAFLSSTSLLFPWWSDRSPVDVKKGARLYSSLQSPGTSVRASCALAMSPLSSSVRVKEKADRFLSVYLSDSTDRREPTIMALTGGRFST
ncbi:hypothetical protein BJX62DRAFT_192395 [Aspergillus germanicus]